MNDTQQPARSNGSSGFSPTPWLLFLLTAVVLGAVVYYGWALLGAEQKRAESAEAALVEAKVKLAELDASKRAIDERLAILEEEKKNLSASMTELSLELKDAEAELEKLKATYDSLEDKLQAEIKKGEIRLTQTAGRIKVDLVDKVLFDSGEAELSRRGIEVLTRVGNVLSRVEDKKIQVSGHTDDAPIVRELTQRFPTNWELSAARAVNVVRFLAEKGGVKPQRLVASGHGQFEPVASNITPKGRAENRRIEILLVPLVKKAPAAQGTVAAAKATAAQKPAARPVKGTRK